MTNTRQHYPTDVSNKAWKVIKKLLPVASGNGRPREYALREIVNAIFYVVRGGIAWRMEVAVREAMPHDLPPWSLTYYYYWHWKKAGVWEAVNAELVELSRKKTGRKKQPSLGILDSQSVKTATPPRWPLRGPLRGAYGGEERGMAPRSRAARSRGWATFDGNKRNVRTCGKINGRKRHVVTDSVGHLLAVKVTAANVSDQAGGLQVHPLEGRAARSRGWVFLTALSKREQGEDGQRPYRMAKILVDSAYQGLIALAMLLFGWVLEVVHRPEGTKGFVVQRKRWEAPVRRGLLNAFTPGKAAIGV